MCVNLKKNIELYTDFDIITSKMLNDLIEKIIVYEADGRGKNRNHKVDIYFNYIGMIDVI